MVFQHWGLSGDPFAAGAPPFVASASHVEAVERLGHAIASAEPLAILRAPAGLGKSTVLTRAIEQARQIGRTIARVSGPIDGADLLGGLAEALGGRRQAGRAAAWRSLIDAAKVCRWQGRSLVLAVDDCQRLTETVDRRDLDRLPHLDPHPGARLTVLLVGREALDDEPACPWRLAIRLAPLSRGEVAAYVDAKLAAAGRVEPTFTPRALTRLHLLSAGIPRGLDRIAALALMAGALKGLEVVGPEVVEGVARECLGASEGRGGLSRSAVAW